MKKALMVTVVFLVTIGLLGCAKTPSPVSAIKGNFVLMSDLVKSLKANGVNCVYKKNPDALFIKEEGTCAFDGQTMDIDLFGTTAVANQSMTFFASLAMGYAIHGDNNWALFVGDEATAVKLSKLLGIKVS